MSRWLHDTIAARIALTCVAGLILFQIANLALLFMSGAPEASLWPAAAAWPRLLARVAYVTHIVDSAPAPERLHLATLLRSPRLDVAVRPTRIPNLQDEGGPRSHILHRMISAELGSSSRLIVVGTPRGTEPATAPAGGPSHEAILAIEVALSDGQWVEFNLSNHVSPYAPVLAFAVDSGLFCLIIGLLSIWMARRIATPIAEFGRAAERFGVDSNAPILAERGPRELRAATRAFNHMQERLRRFIQDRTQMLAAMSHDLRTPLTRLRLRAEFIEDTEQQRKMRADLDAMSVMVESTLVFARDQAQREPRTLVDLSILVADLCEDMADMGKPATFSGAWGTEISCRPISVRRAIANLLDNAVKYGGIADVSLIREPSGVVLLVEDEGPGIPPDAHEKVFAPFYRLDESRNVDTGGVGLGLAVVRSVVREHGGEVTLSNRETGGLRVRIELPLVESS
jgi:signal transduction histidine kinase